MLRALMYKYIWKKKNFSVPFGKLMDLIQILMGPKFLHDTGGFHLIYLLMPWLLPSPVYQQPWHWLCKISRSLSFKWMEGTTSAIALLGNDDTNTTSCFHREVQHINPDSKVHGANMWPTWVLTAPDGPHVGPMNLAIREGFGMKLASYEPVHGSLTGS